MTQPVQLERKVLLVGGAGYIGSVVTRQLLDKGYHVRCLDAFLYWNQSSVYPFLDNPNYEFQCGDFTMDETLTKATRGVTDVILLAGLVGDPITKKYPELSKAINLDGFINALHVLKQTNLERVIFISTCSNYGLIPDNEIADEAFELKPLSAYARAKVDVENALLALKASVRFSATTLRFATAFGLSPRMRFDLTVNEFTRDMYANRDLVVYDADTWRPYCHVTDFGAAIIRVLEAEKSLIHFEVFNVGSEANNYSKRMIVDEIKTFCSNARVRYEKHGSDPRNYRVNFKKIRKLLGFEAKKSVRDGVEELVGALERNLFDHVDEFKNLHGNYVVNDRSAVNRLSAIHT
jgi:nucleoside-diphosphate-sugar epimerase